MENKEWLEVECICACCSMLQLGNVVRTRLSKGAQLPAHRWTREPGARWTLEHSVAYGRVELMA